MSQIFLLKRGKKALSNLSPFILNSVSFSTTKKLVSNDSNSLATIDKSNLNLSIPKTEFNPRFHAVTSETKYHPLTTSSLYNWQRNRDTDKEWIAHDLPMPVYESLHVGHFYNKVMKDIINRYKLLKGFKIDFSMGFNCHGMIIESMALREEVARTKIAKRHSEQEVREISHKYVLDKLKEYIVSFQRWGIMTDFRNSYLTMNPLYEACVLDVFYELLDKKLIYKDVRPMFWSVVQRKAIHEDEVDHDYESKKGHFIKYKILDSGKDESLTEKYPNLHFLAFSTEPWTLTGCKGIALHPMTNYSILECSNGEQYIISLQRYAAHQKFFKNKLDAKVSMRILGDFFRDMTVEDPLLGRNIKVCFDKEIRPNFGSGVNPICPAHFVDDLKIAQDYGLDREGYVDERGLFTEEVGEDLKGKSVLKEASELILEKLEAQNKLLNIEEQHETIAFRNIKSKEKIIIRTTEQWFCRIPEFIKEDFLEELEKSKIIGAKGEEVYQSIQDQLESKSEEWCISSQNSWGIPIPVFHTKGKKNELLLDKSVIRHVQKNFEKYGSEIWWQWSVMDLLPPKYKERADRLEKGNLVFDNLFEGGCAWFAILCKKIHEKTQTIKVNSDGNFTLLPSGLEVLDHEESKVENKKTQSNEETFPASIVIEGLDQNETLLQSMCLSAALIKEAVPFSVLKNHAVIVNQEHEKISKLSPNKIPIDSIIHGVEKGNNQRQYGIGADPARLWVAAADDVVKRFEEIKLETSDIDIKTTEINLIRKIYWNLLRFTSDFKFDASHYTEYLGPVDRLIMSQLQLFLYHVEKAYEAFDLSKVYRLYMDFMKYSVLDVYIETIRNRIISEKGAPRQKSAMRVSAMILENTLLAIAPILCHNAENIYSHINFKERTESIFQNNWPTISQQALMNALDLLPTFTHLVALRETVVSQYENIAQRAHYKDSLLFELHLLADTKSKAFSLLKFLENDLEDFFRCSKVVIHTENDGPLEMKYSALSSFKHKGKDQNEKFEVNIKIFKILQHKCIRCHRYVNEEENQICSGCQEFLPEFEFSSADPIQKLSS